MFFFWVCVLVLLLPFLLRVWVWVWFSFKDRVEQGGGGNRWVRTGAASAAVTVRMASLRNRLVYMHECGTNARLPRPANVMSTGVEGEVGR